MVQSSTPCGDHHANDKREYHEGDRPGVRRRMTKCGNEPGARSRCEDAAKTHASNAQCLIRHGAAEIYVIRLTR